MRSSMTRRQMLTRSVQATASLAFCSQLAPLFATDSSARKFKIGACDWSIGKLGRAEVFDVAKHIGLDGVQVSLGTTADDMRLRKAEIQDEFRAAAKKTGVAIASLAIGELNSVPYKKDARTIPWVEDAVDVCKSLGVQVVLLAFFGDGDLRGDQEGKEEVIRRLKAVAPKAEKAGVILAIESWLSADEHLEIIDRVGSSAVQVYYDVCNSNDRGYDIYTEIRKLGKRICEFHAKENGALLGQGKVDFQKVRQAMDDIDYKGWIQIEGAVPPGGDMIKSYQANCKYLRGIFV